MSPSLVSQFRGSHWYGVGKSKAVLGPWTGGLNKLNTPNRLAPNELQECVNYLIKHDGRLVSRPPITQHGTGKSLPVGGSLYLIGAGAGGNFRAGTGFYGPLAFDVNGLRVWIYNASTDTWSLSGTALPANVDNVIDSVVYNNVTYFLAYDSLNADKKLLRTSSYTNTVAFTTAANTAFGAGTPISNGHLIVLKDRLVFVQDVGIMWSKATDPTIWAVPDGGYVKFSGDALVSFVFQDAIYIFGDSGIWRFTWQSDPSVDGSLEHLSTELILGAAVYNNEIYVSTLYGIFKYLNGFLVSISEKIDPDWKIKVKSLTGSNQPTLSVIENYLLAGPFGTTTELYYVYDFNTGTWTTWQLGGSGNNTSGPNYSIPRSAGTTGALGIKKWLWSNSGKIFSIPADALTGTVYGGYDTSGYTTQNNYWIGYKITTADIDLGEGPKWKRIISSMLEAVYTAVTFLTNAGTIKILLDGVATNLTPPDTDRLAWGKSFRAKKVALQYDSLSATIGTATTPAVELNNIDKFYVNLSPSREVTT